MEFREPIDGPFEQVGPGVLEAVPARVVGRITQAEIGPEVDDCSAIGNEIGDELRGGAVGEGKKRGVDLGELRADGEVGRGEVGMVAADRVVLAVTSGEAHDVDVRVARQDANQLGADVAGRSDDADADLARAAVGSRAPLRARSGPRRAVRRDRRGRSEPRAHWRTWPLTGGWLGLLAETGWTVVMGALLYTSTA